MRSGRCLRRKQICGIKKQAGRITNKGDLSWPIVKKSTSQDSTRSSTSSGANCRNPTGTTGAPGVLGLAGAHQLD
jgi:hypothetical protein